MIHLKPFSPLQFHEKSIGALRLDFSWALMSWKITSAPLGLRQALHTRNRSVLKSQLMGVIKLWMLQLSKRWLAQSCLSSQWLGQHSTKNQLSLAHDVGDPAQASEEAVAFIPQPFVPGPGRAVSVWRLLPLKIGALPFWSGNKNDSAQRQGNFGDSGHSWPDDEWLSTYDCCKFISFFWHFSVFYLTLIHFF